MSLSHAMALAADILRDEEKFVAHPYRDPVGLWTIGYGHLIVPQSEGPGHPTLTLDQGEALLDCDMRRYAEAVLDDAPHLLAEPPGRLAALTSFVFNVGIGAWRDSTIRRRVMASRWDDAAAQFRRWKFGTVNGKKVVLAGLVKRREREATLFRQPAVA